MYTKEDLKRQMKAMGLQSTDTVMIHTSMRKVGIVENGADGLLDAFCEYLHEGLFLVPTHTWNSVNREQPVFDVRSSMPCTGIVPQRAAFRKDGVRSLHPTHSIWAHGMAAQAFVQGEECAESPAPPGFCWERLARENAKILLIGVGNDKNTFIHALDELAEVPDRLSAEPYETILYDAAGNVYHGRMRSHYCSKCSDVSKHYVNFEEALISAGAQTFGRLGEAVVRIVDAARCSAVILHILSRAKEDLCIASMKIPAAYLPEE